MSGTNSLCVGGSGFGGVLNTGYTCIAGFGTFYGTESQQQIKLQSSSTFSNFGVNIKANSVNQVITFRINSGNGNQAITQLAGNDSWASDATHSDSVVAGNAINLTYGSNLGNAIMRGFSLQQHSTTPSVLYAMGAAAAGPGNPFSASTLYTGIIGSSHTGSSTNDDNSKTRIQAAGTLSELGINIITGSSGTVTATCNNAGATGNQTVSVASGTGFFQDTTHSDAIASGTDLATAYASTNASGDYSIISYQFSGVISLHDIGASYDLGLGGGAGNFYGFGGSSAQFSGTESEEYFIQPYAFTAGGLRARTTTGNNATTTIKFRHNSADGNQFVTFSFTNGVVIDATHTDSVSATDTFDFTNTGGLVISSVLVSVDDGSADTVNGAGAISLNIALAAAGTGIFQSAGAVSLNIAVAATGTNIVPASGAIGLNIAVAGAATGIQSAAGSIGLHIDMAGVPKYTFPASAAIGINIAVAGTGTNAAISPGGGDVPIHDYDWKRRYGRWKEIEEELIAAEEARRGKIRAGVVDAYERSVEGKTDPEPETEPEPFKLPAITRQYSARELSGLLHQVSIRKHSTSNHDEQDDEEAILHL